MDPEVFKRLQNLDTSFIENIEGFRALVAASELLIGGVVGYGVFRTLAYETVNIAGKSEKVLKHLKFGSFWGAAAFMGVAFTLDYFTSPFLGSEEAKELHSANEKLARFLQNERENIQTASRDLRYQAARIRRNLGVSLEEVESKQPRWGPGHNGRVLN